MTEVSTHIEIYRAETGQYVLVIDGHEIYRGKSTPDVLHLAGLTLEHAMRDAFDI